MPWRDLDASGYTGVELWSFVTDTGEKLNSIAELLRFIATPGRFVDHPPRRNLETWDRLCARRQCVALGGIDAHQIGIRVGGRVPLRLMAYRRSFRFLRTHLLLERPLTRQLEPDRDAIYSALRRGRAYIAMDSVAPARGFSFVADGDGAARDGRRGAGRSARRLQVKLPQPARVRLMRDGSEVASTVGTELEHETTEPGVYRVEAYRHAHGRERTWILSNPIYLTERERLAPMRPREPAPLS